MQGIGQDQQQDEGSNEAHEDSRCEEGGTVARRRKRARGDVEGLNLRRRYLKKKTKQMGLSHVYFHSMQLYSEEKAFWVWHLSQSVKSFSTNSYFLTHK